MKLLAAVNQYVSYRKSLGDFFETNNFKLRAFARAVGPMIDLSEVQSESVAKFLAGKNPVITRTWHSKYYALRGFYKYVLGRGYAETSPLPISIPKQPPRFVPYIYNVKELRALFDTCLNYQKIKSQHKPYMIRTFLLLLYGTGLRVGEAVSLTLADVNLSQALITIRETKFFKTRFVPIGKQLTQVLQQYSAQRQQEKYSQNPESPFFVRRNGKRVNQSSFGNIFRSIRKKAGVHRTDSVRFQPRLHDLRHTFAVHRLTAWYKEGADVQRLLPVLSVYLGHTCLAATSTYLTMTPAILEEAGRRFEQYAFKEASHD